MKPSVLWYSNSPNTASGYGVCAKHILRGLKARGYEVGMASNFGLLGSPIEIEGYPIFPTGSGLTEFETVQIFLKYGYDILVTQYDVFVLDTFKQLIPMHRIPWVGYVTLDHPEIYPWVKDKLDAMIYRIAMSQYGLGLLEKAGYKDCTFIHHGIDTHIFKPVVGEEYRGSVVTKELLKQHLKFPEDCFLILINKMNKGSRVGYPYMLEGVKIFAENNPDIKTALLMHTDPKQPNGHNIDRLVALFRLEEKIPIRTTARMEYFLGLDEIQMAKMYNGADVLLHCTLSESFGLPIAEAISCGIPVVATDCSSMTELVMPTCKELLVPAKSMHWEPNAMQYWVPDVYEIADALERSLLRDPEKDRHALHEYAMKNWDWESVILPKWSEVLDKIPGLIDEKCMKIPEVNVACKARVYA